MLPLSTFAASAVTSLPRPPREICPPFLPADRASSGVHSWAVPFSWAARPPLLAISRCFSGDIEAKPRRSLRTPSTAFPPGTWGTLRPARTRRRSPWAGRGRPVLTDRPSYLRVQPRPPEANSPATSGMPPRLKVGYAIPARYSGHFLAYPIAAQPRLVMYIATVEVGKRRVRHQCPWTHGRGNMAGHG